MRGNPRKVSNYIEFVNQLNHTRQLLLRQYAKNRVMEPYEGQQGLETYQIARQKLSSGIEKIKGFGNSLRRIRVESKTWDRISNSIKKSLFYGNISDYIDLLSRKTKTTFRDIEQLVRRTSIGFIERGLELATRDDYEAWIVSSAAGIFKRNDITAIEDIKRLTDPERIMLTEMVYPFKSHKYQKLLDSFDVTVNLMLGTVVATNVPGTGLLISLVSMAKTMVRMFHRMGTMSIIHGEKIQNKNQLFRTCAELLRSMEDWETSTDHIPLEPSIISSIYQPPPESEESSIVRLLEAVGIKDMYIAIPGIGMLSLSKINLDEFKINALIKYIVMDYFLETEMRGHEKEVYHRHFIEDYCHIYQCMKTDNILTKIRNRLKDEESSAMTRMVRIKRGLRTVSGKDTGFNSLIDNFNLIAEDIFKATYRMKPSQKKDAVKRMVRKI